MADGTPVYPAGLGSSTALKASRGHKARVDTSPLCIIELRLATVQGAGTPARVLDAMMQGCYTFPSAVLTAEYVQFSIGTTSQRDQHRHDMSALVRRISA